MSSISMEKQAHFRRRQSMGEKRRKGQRWRIDERKAFTGQLQMERLEGVFANAEKDPL
jgi:hypothetical protein